MLPRPTALALGAATALALALVLWLARDPAPGIDPLRGPGGPPVEGRAAQGAGPVLASVEPSRGAAAEREAAPPGAQPARAALELTVELDLVSSDGAPLDTGSVELECPDGSLFASAQADAEGRCRIVLPAVLLACEGLLLRAQAPGHLPVERGLAMPPPGPLTVVLTPFVHLEGVVVDSTTAAPIAGADVSCVAGGGPFERTDAAGRFAGLRVPRRANTTVEVSAAEYLTTRATLTAAALEGGVYRLVLHRGQRVEGQVLGAAGELLSGIELLVDGELLDVTDAHGAFDLLAPMGEWSSTLLVRGEGLAGLILEVRRHEDRIHYPEAWTERGMRISMVPTTRLAGRVLDGAAPVAGARVELSLARARPTREGGVFLGAQPSRTRFELQGGARSAITDEAGRFVVRDLPPWMERCQLRVSHDGRSIDPVPIELGRPGAELEVVVQWVARNGEPAPTSGILEGRVHLNGVPIAEGWIKFVGGPESGDAEVEDGKYRLELSAGSYTIRPRVADEEGRDFSDFVRHLRRDNTVAAGDVVVEDFDLELEMGAITGRVVVGEREEPGAGRRVLATSGRFEALVACNSRGEFEIEVPAEQELRLSVVGEVGGAVTRRARAGDDVLLRIDESTPLELRVRDAATGEAIQGYEAFWRRPDARSWRALATEREEQARPMVRLPLGQCELRLHTGGYVAESFALEVDEALDLLELELARGERVELVVLSASELPRNDLYCVEAGLLEGLDEVHTHYDLPAVAKRFPGRTLLHRRVELGPDGRGYVMGLAPGRYELRFLPPGLPRPGPVVDPAVIEIVASGDVQRFDLRW